MYLATYLNTITGTERADVAAAINDITKDDTGWTIWPDVTPNASGASAAAANAAAIQAAFDSALSTGYGRIELPPGLIYYSGKLTIYGPTYGLDFVGAGRGVTTLLPLTQSDDCIHVRPVSNTATDMCSRVNIREMTIYGGSSNPTAGALVHMERVQQFDIDCELAAGFGGLHLESCRNANIDVPYHGNQNFTGVKAGSYGYLVDAVSGGITPAELHFASNEVRGTNTNNYMDNAIWLKSFDGLFFGKMHFGFCDTGMMIEPQTTSTHLTSLEGDFYPDTCESFGILIYDQAGTYDGIFGRHSITVNDMYNCGVGIAVELSSATSTRNEDWDIFGGQWSDFDTNAMALTEAINLKVHSPSIYAVNNANGGGYGINVGAACNNVTLYPGSVSKGKGAYAPTAGINITNGAQYIHMLPGWQFYDCTADVLDAAAATNNTRGQIITNAGIQTVNANGSEQFFLPAGHHVVKLGATNPYTTITSKHSVGDEFTFIFTGSVTVNDGAGNLKLAGNFSATADDVLRVVYDGTSFIEISRSAN